MAQFEQHGQAAGVCFRCIGATAGNPLTQQQWMLLNTLLRFPKPTDVEMRMECRNLGICLPEGEFRYFQFHFDEKALAQMSLVQEYKYIFDGCGYIIEYLALHLQNAPGGFLSMDAGAVSGLIFTEHYDDAILHTLSQAVHYVKAKHEVAIHASISCKWSDLSKLPSVITMIQDIEKSRAFYGEAISRVYVFPDDIWERVTDPAQSALEKEFYQTAEHICSAIRANDMGMTAMYIRRQLQRILDFCIGMPWPMTLRFTVNRFVACLQTILVNQDLVAWWYVIQRDFTAKMVSNTTREDCLNSSEEIARMLLDHARLREQENNNNMLHDVMTFIRENATDVNMGIPCVAAQFNIRSRVVSARFRQYYGETINDVIHATRVKKAKELLLNTDLPVQEVAQRVGYCSLATMYRAFVKIEGIAPSKLRQS